MSDYKRMWAFRHLDGHYTTYSERPGLPQERVCEVEIRELPPEIPRRSCGHAAEVAHCNHPADGYYVTCITGTRGTCWTGPIRSAERQAIEAWSKP